LCSRRKLGHGEAHAGAAACVYQEGTKVFKPCSGAWDRQGYTNVYLAAAKASIVRAALDAAAKNIASKKKKKRPTPNHSHKAH
jgi:hypothetical protein